jgi:hypothetical protein
VPTVCLARSTEDSQWFRPTGRSFLAEPAQTHNGAKWNSPAPQDQDRSFESCRRAFDRSGDAAPNGACECLP